MSIQAAFYLLLSVSASRSVVVSQVEIKHTRRTFVFVVHLLAYELLARCRPEVQHHT